MMNPTLADLILETKARNEYSYETLAKACGGVPGAGRLHQFATKAQKTFPDPETINGLARGCKVTPLEVIKAAARTVGLSVSDDAADTVYIHGYDQLPHKLKATIQELGEQVAELAQEAGEGHEQRPTSISDAGGKPATHQRRGPRPVPDLDTVAAHDTGTETEKEAILREEAEREQESQDPDDHR